jgi:hypothetical protein
MNGVIDDNRFMRVYLEHQYEKQLSRGLITPENDRFACLKGDNHLRNAGRFECLRGDNHQKPDYGSRRTRLLSITQTRSVNSQTHTKEDALKLPPISLNTNEVKEAKEAKEEKIAITNELKPVFSVQSDYHFPNLCKTEKIPNQKEMIVNSIVVIPIKKEIITHIGFKNGKAIIKDFYEDGSDISQTRIVKKPVYTSWASVLKPKNYIEVTDESQDI